MWHGYSLLLLFARELEQFLSSVIILIGGSCCCLMSILATPTCMSHWKYLPSTIYLLWNKVTHPRLISHMNWRTQYQTSERFALWLLLCILTQRRPWVSSTWSQYVYTHWKLWLPTAGKALSRESIWILIQDLLYQVNPNVVTGSRQSQRCNGTYTRCARCIVTGNALKDDLGKIARVTDIGPVTIYYIYYTLWLLGSHGLPFEVFALMIYDTCVCTAPVPSVLPLGSSAL